MNFMQNGGQQDFFDAGTYYSPDDSVNHFEYDFKNNIIKGSNL